MASREVRDPGWQLAKILADRFVNDGLSPFDIVLRVDSQRSTVLFKMSESLQFYGFEEAARIVLEASKDAEG